MTVTPHRRRAHNAPSNAVAAQELASSNSTLNMFFGGKQRAWMTSAPDGRIAPADPPSQPQSDRPLRADKVRKKSTVVCFSEG